MKTCKIMLKQQHIKHISKSKEASNIMCKLILIFKTHISESLLKLILERTTSVDSPTVELTVL